MTCNDEIYAEIAERKRRREALANDPEIVRQDKEREAAAQGMLEFVLTMRRLGIYEQFSESAKYAKDEQSQKACRDFWHAYCYVVQLPIA